MRWSVPESRQRWQEPDRLIERSLQAARWFAIARPVLRSGAGGTFGMHEGKDGVVISEKTMNDFLHDS